MNKALMTTLILILSNNLFAIEISFKNTTWNLIADTVIFERPGTKDYYPLNNSNWGNGWTEVQRSGELPDTIIIGKRYPGNNPRQPIVDPICIINKNNLDVGANFIVKMHIYIKWAAKYMWVSGRKREINIYYCEIRRLFPHDNGVQKWYSDSLLLRFGPLYYWTNNHYSTPGERIEYIRRYRELNLERWNKDFHSVYSLEK